MGVSRFVYLNSILKGYESKKYIFIINQAKISSKKVLQLKNEHDIELVDASKLLSWG
ncbi:hypothetical protein KKE34_01465 [Patescibacteria group bacterium]|nr:hypothetical protein [Patescibacteria group bacterium]MBU1885257.1 hypothetical protein [Patescibacteria group bacterium]